MGSIDGYSALASQYGAEQHSDNLLEDHPSTNSTDALGDRAKRTRRSGHRASRLGPMLKRNGGPSLLGLSLALSLGLAVLTLEQLCPSSLLGA